MSLIAFSIILCLLVLQISSQTCQDLAASDRLPCWSWWKYDFSSERCHERGCCWSPSLFTNEWCYYPKPKATITHVHVVQGCHLDVGFLETAPDIINLWFHTHLPRAYTIGKQLEAMGKQTTARLTFTAQSWIISLFFNCPLAYVKLGVICPNSTEIAIEAIKNNWITWHAFPFNGEMEIMDPSLIEFGIEMTHELDVQFNKPLKSVLSQRDVPGMTVSTIPILLKHNITAISVGVNGGSTPPDVPQSFIWKNKQTGQSIRTFYLQGGYAYSQGGLGSKIPWDSFAWTGVPGSSHIMVVDWRGDNAGPPNTVDEVLNDWYHLSEQFPSAQIMSSTFDAFVESVSDIPDSNLPLIDEEIGDSWIHGVASDPLKLSKLQIALEQRTACINSGECSTSDPKFWEFSRMLLKNGEHTWGLDNKLALKDYVSTQWTNKDLQKIKQTSGGARIVKSWNTQREMGLDLALEALQNHPLRLKIETQFKTLIPTIPSLSGFKKIPVSQLPNYFSIGNDLVKIGFDSTIGSINYLVINNITICDSQSLMMLEYTTYDGDDYYNFMVNYNYLYILYPVDDLYDFDKVGINSGGASHRNVNPTLNNFWMKNNGDNSTQFILQLSYPSTLHDIAGTPDDIWMNFVVFKNGSISVSLNVFNKTATRLPEAHFLRFKPPTSGQWNVEKLDLPVDIYHVVTGGAKHMHSISKKISFSNDDYSMSIRQSNSPLISFGGPNSFPTPTDKSPDWTEGVSFILHDNIWNTNYIMWYPFNDGDESIKFNYMIDFQINNNNNNYINKMKKYKVRPI